MMKENAGLLGDNEYNKEERWILIKDNKELDIKKYPSYINWKKIKDSTLKLKYWNFSKILKLKMIPKWKWEWVMRQE